MNRSASKQDTRNGQQGPVVLGKHGESQLDRRTLSKGKDAVGINCRWGCRFVYEVQANCGSNALDGGKI